MKQRIFSILATIAIAFAAMAQSPEVKEVVDKVNAKCPYEYSEGVILQGVAIENGDIVETYTVNPKKIDYDFLKGNQEMLFDVLTAEINTDNSKESQIVRKACKEQGFSIIYRYTDGNGDSFEVVVKPSDIH